MRQPVSKECLECIMLDIHDAYWTGEPIVIAPVVLRRMVEELVSLRAGEFQEQAQ